MEHVKRVGPKASALKYDLLTALTVTGLYGTPTEQTSCLRLTALITARYNWRLDEVCVGHEALAQMWAVNTRTVKREMKRLMDWGVLLCIRPGVRGRVGAYRLNYARIYELSRPVWAQVGADFEDRMIETSGEKTVVRVDFQAPPPRLVAVPVEPGQGGWAAVRHALRAQDVGVYENWFAKLAVDQLTDDTLVLRAPNSFVARYIETHFARRLAEAVDLHMPTSEGRPRRITLVHQSRSP